MEKKKILIFLKELITIVDLLMIIYQTFFLKELITIVDLYIDLLMIIYQTILMIIQTFRVAIDYSYKKINY